MSTIATPNTLRYYLIFWIAQIFSLLGSTIVQFVIIWWIVVKFVNPIFLSLAYLLGIGIQIIFMPIAGVFVDRWNRKLVLGIADGLQALGALGLIIVFNFQNQIELDTMFWIVLVLIAFRGIISSFHDTAARAIIPIMVPRKHLSRLNGMQFIFLGVINIIGPAVGAILYQLFPLTESGIIIWIDVITFITAVIPLVVISIPHINSILESNGYKRAQTSFVQEFTEGIQILKSKTGLLPLLYVFTAINFLEIPIIVLGPIFIYSVHLGQATDLALVVAASQLGMLLSGLWILFRREWRRKAFIIIVALYIQLFGYFLQVITPTGVFWFMAIGTFIFGTTLPITNAMFKTIFQVLIPPELQGRVTAITAAISGSIMPIAMLLSGPIAEILGFVEFFLLTIILGIIVITVMWLFTDLPALDELQEMNIQKDAIGPQNVPGVTQ
ncbi:MAG: MFS transporter [Candidatus Hodarchaeales archaeon]